MLPGQRGDHQEQSWVGSRSDLSLPDKLLVLQMAKLETWNRVSSLGPRRSLSEPKISGTELRGLELHFWLFLCPDPGERRCLI